MSFVISDSGHSIIGNIVSTGKQFGPPARLEKQEYIQAFYKGRRALAPAHCFYGLGLDDDYRTRPLVSYQVCF